MLDTIFAMMDWLVKVILFLLLCFGLFVAMILAEEFWKSLTTRRTNIIYEAKCQKCHALFCPPNKHDLIHIYTEYDEPCGGKGKIIGKYKIQ